MSNTSQMVRGANDAGSDSGNDAGAPFARLCVAYLDSSNTRTDWPCFSARSLAAFLRFAERHSVRIIGAYSF